ncbi:hypothetical protein BDV26DRAFT_294361 [Aspergillus bertholletiae]|uniref:Uncharacterized protein n=1 Tax=Aspergillus bertholletiae TaxID=1226010 RepID=A0A5N7B428_9EURO|nr:hypothetical protein BDV26DRAFT_294361 [Aspergillus bertholletiae]
MAEPQSYTGGCHCGQVKYAFSLSPPLEEQEVVQCNCETLLSVLTEQSWLWDSEELNQITFDKDGTGRLICRGELSVWIAAEFDWKIQNSECLDQCLHISGGYPPRRPSLLSQFTLEMTLTKRRIPKLGDADMQEYRINEELLSDAAFLPKQYVIKLETDRFLSGFDYRTRHVTGRFIPGFDRREHLKWSPKYALRMVFDKSPYPLREEWKSPDGAPGDFEFSEWKESTCQQLHKQSGWWKTIFSKILRRLGGC